MKSNLRREILLALMALMLIVFITPSQSFAPVSAQSGGGYDLTWNVIADGGAMFSTGGPYSLGGTIGQAEAATVSGGSYTLTGGFWGGLQNLVSYPLHFFLPLIQKNP